MLAESSFMVEEAYPLESFNPFYRDKYAFMDTVPSILELGVAKVNWIFSIETFVDGVDLSHWNWTEGKHPDFRILADNGFDFVIFKATQGTWFEDNKFEPGWRGAIEQGLMTMVYHFFEGRFGGAEQARYCLNYIAQYLTAVNGKTIIFNDIERMYGEDMGQRQRRARAFNQTIVEEGLQTGNYSSPSLWKALMGNIPLFWVNEYYQWVAHWTPALTPTLPIGWTKEMCKFWQYGISPTYSWAKKVGTDGKVDVVRYYGTIQDLKKTLGITPPITSDCCDELRQRIAGLAVTLAFTNENLANIGDLAIQNKLTIDDSTELINTELARLRLLIAFGSDERTALQTQIDVLVNAAKEIKILLP